MSVDSPAISPFSRILWTFNFTGNAGGSKFPGKSISELQVSLRAWCNSLQLVVAPSSRVPDIKKIPAIGATTSCVRHCQFSKHPPGILATLHVLGQGLQTRQGRSLLCLSHRSAETNRGKTGIRQIWSYSRPGGSRIWSAWRGVKIMFVVPGNLWEFSCWELDPEPFMLMETYVPSLLLGAPWGLAASLALPGNICSAGCALGAQERPNPKGIRPSQQRREEKRPSLGS